MLSLAPFVAAALSGIIFISAVFLAATHLKRYDIVDFAWGILFIVIAGSAWATTGWLGPFGVAEIALILVVVWGIRLARHISKRLAVSQHEDYRYKAMRDKWGGSADRQAYVRVFLTQAILAFVISLPVLIAIAQPTVAPNWLSYVAVGIWVFGFVIEFVADAQLKRFVSDPKHKGQLMVSGLWRYSRHPNYFGEITQWWGIGLLCLNVNFGWIGLVGPLLITLLLIFVSGLPLSEAHMRSRKGWGAYSRRTSVLIPLPPKR